MSRKTNRNSSTQTASKPMKRRFTRFSIIDLVIAAPLLIAILVMSTLPLTEEASGAPPVTEDQRQRANAAITARYNGLAAYYAVENESVGVQRANAALSARYSGQATFYAAETKPVSDSAMLASNPELSIVHRYTGPEEKIGQPVRFDIEQLRQTYFQDWTIEADAVDPSPVVQPVDNLAENPELSVVRRYAAERKPVSDSVMLAANPELSIVHRYTGPEEKISQPVRFDIEQLRQTYFQNWAIESDAVDVSLIELPARVNLNTGEVDTAALSPDKPAPKGHALVMVITFNSEALRDTYFDDWGIEADAIDVVRQPVTFDIEQLRQTYFQDWTIEADAADVTILEQPAQTEPTAEALDIGVLLRNNPNYYHPGR